MILLLVNVYMEENDDLIVRMDYNHVLLVVMIRILKNVIYNNACDIGKICKNKSQCCDEDQKCDPNTDNCVNCGKK